MNWNFGLSEEANCQYFKSHMTLIYLLTQIIRKREKGWSHENSCAGEVRTLPFLWVSDSVLSPPLSCLG